MKETLRGKIAAWLWLEEIAGEEERIKKQKKQNKKDTLTVYAEKIWAYKTSGLQSDLVSWKKWQGG